MIASCCSTDKRCCQIPDTTFVLKHERTGCLGLVLIVVPVARVRTNHRPAVGESNVITKPNGILLVKRVRRRLAPTSVNLEDKHLLCVDCADQRPVVGQRDAKAKISFSCVSIENDGGCRSIPRCCHEIHGVVSHTGGRTLHRIPFPLGGRHCVPACQGESFWPHASVHERIALWPIVRPAGPGTSTLLAQCRASRVVTAAGRAALTS